MNRNSLKKKKTKDDTENRKGDHFELFKVFWDCNLLKLKK